jgi:sphinganine-1-phosphate aldolase
VITSGGTESIISAVLAHREWAPRAGRASPPQMIKPETAHPAFDKGAHLFGIEVVIGAGRPRDHPGRRRLRARPS